MTESICTVCGWEGDRRRLVRGSKAVEIMIWSILFFPGPLYSIWRRAGKDPHCPNCMARALVKVTSDQGQMIQRKLDIELGIISPIIDKPKTDGVSSFGNTKSEMVSNFGDQKFGQGSSFDEKAADQLTPRKPVNPDEW